MAQVVLPLDAAAELAALAGPILSATGARLAVGNGLRPAHFYNPRYARIFKHAVGCPVVGERERIATLAYDCGEFESFIEWIAETPRRCLLDDRGHYARRVIDASRRRDRLHALLAEINGEAA